MLDKILDLVIESWNNDPKMREQIKARGIEITAPVKNKVYEKCEFGSIITVSGVEGYVIEQYEDGTPMWLMSTKQYGKNGITWDEAMRIILPKGWILPSAEQFMFLRYGISKLLREEIVDHEDLGHSLWSSSPYLTMFEDSKGWRSACSLYVGDYWAEYNNVIQENPELETVDENWEYRDEIKDYFRVRAFYKIERD